MYENMLLLLQHSAIVATGCVAVLGVREEWELHYSLSLIILSRYDLYDMFLCLLSPIICFTS